MKLIACSLLTAAVAMSLVACPPPDPGPDQPWNGSPPRQPKPLPTVKTTPDNARDGYRADMDRCTTPALYPTLADSAACTAEARKRWHRLPDGGADPAYPHVGEDGGAQ